MFESLVKEQSFQETSETSESIDLDAVQGRRFTGFQSKKNAKFGREERAVTFGG